MSAIALVTFIEIYDPQSPLIPASGDISDAVQHRFQNSEPSSAGITFNGQIFHFLSFIYQGATRSKDGNNLESAIILANESEDREGSGAIGTNKLSMSYAAEAVNKAWSIRVTTCKMTDLTFSSVESVLAVDTETSSLNPLEADLVGISLCYEANQAYYIPLGLSLIHI